MINEIKVSGHKAISKFWCMICGEKYENIIQISIEYRLKMLNSFFCVKCFNKYFRYRNFSQKRNYVNMEGFFQKTKEKSKQNGDNL